MPSTYASDSDSARTFDLGPLEPTMMPDRIGIIGSTQGVNVSASPAPKKNSRIQPRWPDSSTSTKRLSSPWYEPRAAGVSTSELASLVSRPGTILDSAPAEVLPVSGRETEARLTLACCSKGT